MGGGNAGRTRMYRPLSRLALAARVYRHRDLLLVNMNAARIEPNRHAIRHRSCMMVGPAELRARVQRGRTDVAGRQAGEAVAFTARVVQARIGLYTNATHNRQVPALNGGSPVQLVHTVSSVRTTICPPAEGGSGKDSDRRRRERLRVQCTWSPTVGPLGAVSTPVVLRLHAPDPECSHGIA